MCRQIALLTLLFSVYHSTAQNINTHKYGIEKLGAEEGLDACTELLMDNKGFLWIGSFNGLHSFDGNVFIHYSIADGLPDDGISLLTKDIKGNVYISSATGISRFVGDNNRKFRYYPASATLIGVETICAVDSNNIYAGSNELEGVFYLHKDSIVIIPGIKATVYSVKADKQGNVYAWALDGGLYKVLKDTCELINFEQPAVSMPYNILTTGSDGYVYFYNGKKLSKVWQKRLTGEIDMPGFAAAQTVKIKDNAGSFIFSNVDGFYRMSVNGVDTLCIANNTVFKQVRGIAQGNGGAYYFSDDYGLYRMQEKLSTLKVLPRDNSSFFYHYTNIQQMPACSNNTLLLQQYLPPKDIAKLQQLSKGYNYLYKDRQDTLWFCSQWGLYTLNGGLKLRYVTPHYWDQSYDSTFKQITEAKDGTLWIASYNGIISYKGGVFNQYIAPGDPFGRTAYTLAINKRGDVIAGTANGVFALQNGEFTDLCITLHLPRSAYDRCCQNAGGKVFISQSTSIYAIAPAAGKKLALSDSLVINWGDRKPTINAIKCDKEDNLWVYYGKELVVFLKDKNGNYNVNRRIAFSEADGIKNLNRVGTSFLALDNGNLDLITPDSLHFFNPSFLLANYNVDTIYVSLTGLLLNRLPPDWKQLGFVTGDYGIPVQPQFNYLQNYLTFQFAAIDHRHPKYVTYRYQLKGVDKN